MAYLGAQASWHKDLASQGCLQIEGPVDIWYLYEYCLTCILDANTKQKPLSRISQVQL